MNHTYTEETQYSYKCGKCNKTWMAYNFYDIAICPHCQAKSVVYKTKDCKLNQTCACKT